MIFPNSATGLIIKSFVSTRFNFVATVTIEVEEKEILYDLVDIQDHLNNQLTGKTFGASVREFDFGYEMYDFKGDLKPSSQTANLIRYGTKRKNLLVVKQFDFQQFKNKSYFEQFEILKRKIVEAIHDTDTLRRKPKNFDKRGFVLLIEKILNEYQQKFCR